MSDQTVTLRLTAQNGQLVAVLRASKKELTDLGVAGNRGGEQAAAGLHKTSTEAAQTSRVLGDLKNVAIGYFSVAAAFQGTRALARDADAYSNITAKVRLAAGEHANLQESMKGVFNVAQSTFNTLDGTAALVQRGAQAFRGYGQTYEEAFTNSLAVSELFNKSLVISGASSEESAASALQFSQALASGRFQGDEFRSVLENNSRFAELLADSLHVNVGELREMSAAGELNTQSFINLIGKTGRLNEEFDRMPLTIGRAKTLLDNALTKFIGEADQARGSSRAVANGIKALADNLGPVTDALFQVGAATAIAFAGRGLQSLGNYIGRVRESIVTQAAAASAEKFFAESVVNSAKARAVDIAATLRTIELAREELIVNQQLARVELDANQRTLKATESMALLSGSLRERRIATEQATAAQARLNEVTNQLAMLGRQQVALQGQLGAAANQQIQAQGRLADVASRSSIAMTGLKKVGSGLFALMGGWPGIALAAAFGLYQVKQAIDENEKAAIQASLSLKDYTEQLTERTRQEGIARELGGNSALVAQVDAYRQSQEELRGLNAQLTELNAQFVQIASSGGERGLAFISSRIETLNRQIETATNKQAEFLASMLQSGQKIPEALSPTLSMLQDVGDELSGFLSLLNGANAAPAAQMAKDLTEFNQALADGTEKLKEQEIELRKGLRARLEYQATQAAGVDSLDKLTPATRAAIDANVAQAAATKQATEAQAKANRAVEEAKKKIADHRREVERLAEAQLAFAVQTDQMAAQLAGPQAVALQQYKEGMIQASVSLDKHVISVDQFNARQRALEDGLKKSTAEIQRQRTPIEQMLDGLREEAKLIGLSSREREVAIARREAEAALIEQGISLSSAEAQARLAEVDSLVRSNQAHSQFAEVTAGIAQDYQQNWISATDNVYSAFGEFVASGARDFSNLGRNLKDTAKRFLADLVAMFLRNTLMLRINVAAGGMGSMQSALAGGMPGADGGAGGGLGGLGNIASMFSGGLGSSLVGAGAGLGGSLGAGLAFSGGAISNLGFFSGLGASASAGMGSMAAGNFLLGAGQMLPVVGTIIAAAMAVDKLTGGGLFGTKFKTTGSGSQVSIGDGGASGFQFENQKKKKSLFRGSKSRTLNSALDDDAQSAIDDLFSTVQQSMAVAAAALGSTVPALVSGSFRQEFDAKGNLKTEFSTIAGRVYKEGQEAFAKRLQAENVLATIDAALAPTATVQGEASRISERWRSDAEKLLSGAQFLLTAAADMRNGFNLLGDGTLTQITGLVEDMAKAGEPLSNTYARVAGATKLLDEALDLSGVALDLGREQFVRFATDIADAAGGLDRAQSLWSNYFTKFFSENERAALVLSNAKTGASKEFTDIGLSSDAFAGSTGTAAFRQLFEQVLPTLSADAVVQWLEAANALGAVIDAQTALNVTLDSAGNVITQAQRDLDSLLSGVSTQLAELDMSPLEIELSHIDQAMAETISQAMKLGATEEQLAMIRELGARQSANAVQAEVDKMQATFAELADGIGRARQSISDSILSIQRTQPGFSESGFQAGRIADLRASLASAADPHQQAELIDQIREATVARYNAELSSIEQARQAQDAAQTAAINAWQAQQEAARRLRDFVDNLGVSTNSPLTAMQRFGEAQRVFDQTLARARGGDAQSVSDLQRAAESLLQENRAVFGVSDRAVALFDQVRASVGDVANRAAGGSAPPIASGFERQSLDTQSQIAALQASAIAELQGLDDQLALIHDAAQTDMEDNIAALRERFEQADTQHVEMSAWHAENIAQSAAQHAEMIKAMQDQQAALQLLAAELKDQANVSTTAIEQQSATLERLIATQNDGSERIGRAIERSVLALERA